MGTPEGRARFTTQARPLWQSLPDGALKRQMLGEITRLAALPEVELQAEWAPAATPAAEASARSWHKRPAAKVNLATSRRPPRRPEDRIVQLLLMQASWWDRLSAEDHELLHALPSPHVDLVAWLERDVTEHGPRPWAALRAALADDPALQSIVGAAGDDAEELEAEFSDLRRLLDGRLLELLGAQQRGLADAVATDPQARASFQRLFERMRVLKQQLGPTTEVRS
mgnify:CR=1 FL=1